LVEATLGGGYDVGITPVKNRNNHVLVNISRRPGRQIGQAKTKMTALTARKAGLRRIIALLNARIPSPTSSDRDGEVSRGGLRRAKEEGLF